MRWPRWRWSGSTPCSADVAKDEAERVIGALTADDGTAARVRVIRDGTEGEIAAADLVRGDLVRVGPGMQVAADARLVAADGLTVDEPALTGETMPDEKRADAEVGPDAPPGARPTMLHAGTLVAGGRGIGLVVATGARTVSARTTLLGARASRPRAPIEAALDGIGCRLALASRGPRGILFGIGWMRGYAIGRLIREPLAPAVAAVPEGLPVVAMNTMARGLRRMERRGILIRRIDAVAWLGVVRTICLDKPGTLTQNRMQVIAAALSDDGRLDDRGRADGPSAAERALLDFAVGCGVDVAALRGRHRRCATVVRAGSVGQIGCRTGLSLARTDLSRGFCDADAECGESVRE